VDLPIRFLLPLLKFSSRFVHVIILANAKGATRVTDKQIVFNVLLTEIQIVNARCRRDVAFVAGF